MSTVRILTSFCLASRHFRQFHSTTLSIHKIQNKYCCRSACFYLFMYLCIYILHQLLITLGKELKFLSWAPEQTPTGLCFQPQQLPLSKLWLFLWHTLEYHSPNCVSRWVSIPVMSMSTWSTCSNPSYPLMLDFRLSLKHSHASTNHYLPSSLLYSDNILRLGFTNIPLFYILLSTFH